MLDQVLNDGLRQLVHASGWEGVGRSRVLQLPDCELVP